MRDVAPGEMVIIDNQTVASGALSSTLQSNLKSISRRCHLFKVALVRNLTKETTHLPLGCLQGGPTHARPCEGHSVLVLGAICSFLELFCGHSSPYSHRCLWWVPLDPEPCTRTPGPWTLDPESCTLESEPEPSTYTRGVDFGC